MANRLVLTLLALLTGLVAQIAPSQARAECAAAATLVIAASPAIRARAAPVELARLPEPGLRHARIAAGEGQALNAPLWRAPSVRIGIDRARQ